MRKKKKKKEEEQKHRVHIIQKNKNEKDIGAARNRTGAGAATTRRHTTRPQHLCLLRYLQSNWIYMLKSNNATLAYISSDQRSFTALVTGCMHRTSMMLRYIKNIQYPAGNYSQYSHKCNAHSTRDQLSIATSNLLYYKCSANQNPRKYTRQVTSRAIAVVGLFLFFCPPRLLLFCSPGRTSRHRRLSILIFTVLVGAG